MTITRQEFLLRARLDEGTLEAWVAEEWLIPGGSTSEPAFTDADIARAALIRDLRHDLAVNDPGIGVILSLDRPGALACGARSPTCCATCVRRGSGSGRAG